MELSKKKQKNIYFFLAIPVALYIFMAIVPTIISFVYSLYDWSGGPVTDFIGLGNYKELITDKVFWESFTNSMIFTVLMVVGQIGIALFLTIFFATKWIKLVKFHRFVIFLPVVISPIVIGLLWQMIYNNQFGLLNNLLTAVGLENWIRPWLDDPKLVMITVSIPVIWQYVGFFFVILSSAVASIPKEVMEASEMDGVSGFKKAFKITIPMIYGTLKVCVVLGIIGALKAFDHIMVLTNGGPGTSSQTMALYGYNAAFGTLRLGYSNAIAIGILIITVLITIISRLVMGGKRYE